MPLLIVPRLRLTVQWLVAVLAVLACLGMTHEMIRHTTEPVYVTVSTVVGSFCAFGSIRKPWLFLTVLALAMAIFPKVDDSSEDVILGGMYVLGTILGALAGWIIRSRQKRVNSIDENIQ